MRPRLLSDADLDRAIARMQTGEVPKAVAASLGVHGTTLTDSLARRGLALDDLKPPTPPPAQWAVVHLRLTVADARALNAYADERGATASDVVRAALRAVGVTDPSRAGSTDLNVPPRRREKPPKPPSRAAERQSRIARVVAERGRPVGEPAVRALAAELGINWRTLYRDLVVVGRRLVKRNHEDRSMRPSRTP